jgi:flagellar motor component MotA
MFGLIAMLGAMGAGNGMDLGALTGGAAVALITALYGLVFAFCLFLPLQYYFQHQLDQDS